MEIGTARNATVESITAREPQSQDLDCNFFEPRNNFQESSPNDQRRPMRRRRTRPNAEHY